MNNFILFGFPSSGKSTFGRKIAEKLGFSFLDTDRYIEQFYPGHTVREIVEHFGWEAFRALEADAIASFEELQRHVIAVGGGAVLDPENVKQLQKLGKMIYLKMDKEELRRNLFKPPLPLYLDEEDPEGSFEKLYVERKKIYEAIPAIQIEVGKEESLMEMFCGK